MLKVYDHIIVACKKEDMEKATAGLVELIDSLNFDYEDEALRLLELYRYCLKNLKEDGFEQVTNILGELRKTWIQALNNPQGQNLTEREDKEL